MVSGMARIATSTSTAEGTAPRALSRMKTTDSGDVDAFGYKRDNYRLSATWRHDHFSLNWFAYSLAPQKNNSNQEAGYFMNQSMGIRPKYLLKFTDAESLEFNGSFFWGDFGDSAFFD